MRGSPAYKVAYGVVCSMLNEKHLKGETVMIVNPPKKDAPVNQLEPLAVDCRTAARLLGVCERTVLKLAKEGKIACKKIGWRSLYPVASLRAFLESPDND